MGLFEDAVAISEGKLDVVDSADVLERAEALVGRPVPVASHRAGTWCTVLFLIRRSDGDWQDEVVPVRGGEVGNSSGASGGIVLRSMVQPGAPFVEGEARSSFDDGTALVQVNGVSADERVGLVCEGSVVAEAQVAAHGRFLVTAILRADDPVSVCAV